MADRTDLFVDVIVPLALPQKYTYRVPQEFNDEVYIGKRALVQFGKSKFYSAIIYSVHTHAPTAYVAKYIDSVIDEKPIVTEKQLKLWDWLTFYYMCGDECGIAFQLKVEQRVAHTIEPRL
jgi:primosomal protein N' (replication factor Y)